MYTIEVGKGPKGSYRVRYSIDNPATAVFYYKCINIGNGYKKRLCEDGKVLRKAMS